MEATRDNNHIPILLATSNADGTTPIMINMNPNNHCVEASNGPSGSDLSGDIALRDNNHIPVMMGVSSADGITPTPIYADSTTNQLLIKSA